MSDPTAPDRPTPEERSQKAAVETTIARLEKMERDAPVNRLERRVRHSALIVLLGTIVVIASMFWDKPTAFLVFAGVGGLAIAIGLVLFIVDVLIDLGILPEWN